MHNVIILGSGCAGNTAAIYTARANLKPLVVIGHEPGGQLSLTTAVENFPGFPGRHQRPRPGGEHEEAGRASSAPNIMYGTVTEADLSSATRSASTSTANGIETRTLIIASGASARWLGLPNEQKLIGHGVSSCATCDGVFYRERKDHGGGRRRLGDGGSQFPHALRLRGDAGASPRRIPRLEDHARPRARQPENQIPA